MEVVESLLVGDYKIIQDTERYRFTSDSVLLARFVTAKKGERVADFCAGSGIVGIHFFAENEGIAETVLFERDPVLAEMSERSVSLNGLQNFRVEKTRVQDLPPRYTEYFSLVLCNPPYERSGFENANAGKAPCRKELDLTLGELCAAASRALKFRGRFALIHRADRVSELLCTLTAHNLEPKRLRFVAGREGRKPYAVLVMAVKGGRKGVEVLPAIINSKGGRP